MEKYLGEENSVVPGSSRYANSDDEGFAIVVVMAILSLIALVAIVLQKSVAVDIAYTSYLTQHTKAEALADGLTRLALHHLTINRPADGRSGLFHLDGIPLTCRSGSSAVSISFINTDGQININRASQPILERIFGGIGLGGTQAAQLAQDIIDFRSPGDTSISGGRKREIYQQAGLSHGPKNGPLETVGELEQVIGMTPALLERLRPLLTVHSRFGAINPSVVSLPVAVALSGGSDQQSLDILQGRLNLPIEFTYIPKTRGTGSTASNTFVVRVAVSQGGIARFTRSAVIELTSANRNGAAIKEWTELDPGRYGIDPPAADDTPPCIGGVLWLEPA